jgi:hypothetical protein
MRIVSIGVILITMMGMTGTIQAGLVPKSSAVAVTLGTIGILAVVTAVALAMHRDNELGE